MINKKHLDCGSDYTITSIRQFLKAYAKSVDIIAFKLCIN